jgi:multimeric flavodoxin WrbA
MARILGVSGSPRKSVTEYCVKEALRAAEEYEGIQTDFFTVRGLDFGFCIHCDRCLKENKIDCVRHNDDLTGFAKRFMEYDGYIVGTPVYDMNVTGQLLTLFNRMRAYWLVLKDNPSFFYRKVGAAIAVGGVRNGGQETALIAVNNFFFAFGITPVSAGPSAYNGASVWSKNITGSEGALQDPVGMETVRALGRRVGLTAATFERGSMGSS